MTAQSINKRKAENKLKYDLGGLIVKSGLDQLAPDQKDILLGALMYTKYLLDNDEDHILHQHCQQIGSKAFAIKGAVDFDSLQAE